MEKSLLLRHTHLITVNHRHHHYRRLSTAAPRLNKAGKFGFLYKVKLGWLFGTPPEQLSRKWWIREAKIVAVFGPLVVLAAYGFRLIEFFDSEGGFKPRLTFVETLEDKAEKDRNIYMQMKKQKILDNIFDLSRKSDDRK